VKKKQQEQDAEHGWLDTSVLTCFCNKNWSDANKFLPVSATLNYCR